VETISLVIVAVAAIVVIVGVPMLRQAPQPPAAPAPLLSAVLDALPGGNCGACGNASCFAAALAVQEGRASTTVCTTGGAATAVRVARALGAHGRA
jgi:Na+-translocating ferredoxin:NAD+ oxidoreductase RNF subunit RnfB